ncbi:hypothetical protein OSB04_008897 [Centaurea solstitialis]|uniref:Uncharacterized protein n=1 Tax=Centaurea solstitialis TaxID=347529 RepID=A0AA38WJZ2_9ASTR|nr:hypothetical protein OSB04_008897 [Centaurea solstitialis]
MESLDAEDTAFYAHLTNQILLLVDDKDDDETHAARNRRFHGDSEFRRRPVCGGSGAGESVKSGWLAGGGSLEVPGWLESLWASNGGRGGAGTGVFIPHVVAAGKPRRRRRHKPRKNDDGGRIIHSSAGQKIHG